MIDRLRGEVLEVREGGVVLEVGGVGLWVTTPRGGVPPIEDGEVTLYTHLHVREDALELYGFASPQERALFRALIQVSGVGPKVALALLSALAAEQLQAAILTGDVGALQRVKGIGKKVAERLVLELRGKLESLGPVPSAGTSQSAHEQAAYLALTQTLGFGAQEARRALDHVRADGDSTEALVKKALAWLSGHRR